MRVRVRAVWLRKTPHRAFRRRRCVCMRTGNASSPFAHLVDAAWHVRDILVVDGRTHEDLEELGACEALVRVVAALGLTERRGVHGDPQEVEAVLTC